MKKKRKTRESEKRKSKKERKYRPGDLGELLRLRVVGGSRCAAFWFSKFLDNNMLCTFDIYIFFSAKQFSCGFYIFNKLGTWEQGRILVA